ncbi:hypothetical protein [Carnobacterium maltaromaticum]|uniref:hypothetical protein n=1 Tax=Carnobacterium maltaromaticum TaxID=2751 RepID=UPI00026C8308|nr:hypothetical protein [Carnobacterium maltaromaticum]
MTDSFDSKGHKITTYEGHRGFVSPEIKDYFKEKYLSQGVRVVPGHWPTMQTEADVDKWISSLKLIETMMDDMFDEEDGDDD